MIVEHSGTFAMLTLTSVSSRNEYAGVYEKQGSDGGGIPACRHLSPLAMDIEGLHST